MMALMEPSEGEVVWDGRPVRERNERELTRERLQFGYLFQGAALFDSMSVFENVQVSQRLFGREDELKNLPDEENAA